MEAVTISPKYQVVIPRKVRESLHISPRNKRSRLLPMAIVLSLSIYVKYKISEMRGFLKGINTSFKREPDRI